MKLRFMGEDGSMGLTNGQVYDCIIESRYDNVWVIWLTDNPGSCPYTSLKVLLHNWEEV